MNTEDLADIRQTADLAINNGYQLCIHAIGDRGNREVLNIYEEAFKAHPDKKLFDAALEYVTQAIEHNNRD